MLPQLRQWAEVQEQLRLNKIYQGLRVSDDRPRYIFDGKGRDYYRKFHPDKKIKSIFVPGHGIKYYRPIFGASPGTYYMRADGELESKTGADGPGNDASKCMDIAAHSGDTFAAGDVIKCCDDGGNFGRLILPSAGSEGSPILYEPESGDSPIFTTRGIVSGSGTAENWTEDGSNVWYISSAFDPLRIWLDSTEYLRAESSKSDITSTKRWYWDDDTDRLYVYATENPASFYSTIEATEITSGTQYTVLFNESINYITLDGLDIRGGENGIYLDGINNLILKNCLIGRDGFFGIMMYGVGENQNDYVTIYDCTFESGYNLDYSGYSSPFPGPGDGIRLQYGANYWDVYDNDFSNWGHSAFGIGTTANTISYNKFHDNEISAPNMKYARAFGCAGEDGKCVGNEFYRNYCHDLTVRSQVGGNGNKIYYNVFYNITDSPTVNGGEVGQGLSLESVDNPSVVCDGNMIYNNLFMDIDSEGIRLEEFSEGDIENNIIRNNILVNCGRASEAFPNIALRIDDHADVNNNTFENNCLYKSGETDIVHYRGSACTVAEFESGVSNGDVAADNITGDPLIMDAANGDFTLESGSPCINVGKDVSLTLDFNKIPVGRGTAPDMGACETLKGGPRRL